MSKLGQLYIQDGYSGDNQILSSEWIEQATSSAVSTGLQPLSVGMDIYFGFQM